MNVHRIFLLLLLLCSGGSRISCSGVDKFSAKIAEMLLIISKMIETNRKKLVKKMGVSNTLEIYKLAIPHW